MVRTNRKEKNMNYDLEMQTIIRNLQGKPKLLLHACCAPCSSYVLEALNEHFAITIYFYNPNMNNLEEYDKRFEQFSKLLKGMNLDIEVIKPSYDNREYLEIAKPFKNEKEGGLRCHECYYLRLEKTALYAKENNYDYFATTLTVSPYKNAKLINEIGLSLMEKTGVNYLPSDFKKRNGYKRSIELSKEFDLYRQIFCGCIYSKVAESSDL